MAVLDPEEVLQQAERLVKPCQPGPPRQVDVRRALSSAYYALYHCIVVAVADEFVGKANRGTARHTLVYRSVDHHRISKVCTTLSKPGPDLAPLVPCGFGEALREFGSTVVDLQAGRHEADDDPAKLRRTSKVILAVSRARQALAFFGQAGGEQRLVFLTLLAFQNRA
jgi:hypothetical protein